MQTELVRFQTLCSIISLTAWLTCLVPNSAQANAQPKLSLTDRVTQVGSIVTFIVAPTDADGVVPSVFLSDAPANATLTDNGDGTRTFRWTPQQSGDYIAQFTVVDGQDRGISNTHSIKIKVYNAAITLALTSESNALNSQTTVVSPPPPQTTTANTVNTASFDIGNQAGDVQKILSNIPTSQAQLNVQQTPLAIADGYVYTTNIEPGPNGDVSGIDQRTIVRQGKQNESGSWEWKSTLVEDRTWHNKWHTAPSVAVDKSGAVHVAYNMHNLPWQYQRTEQPHDISTFAFKGQQISDDELRRAVYENKTSFPTNGKAEIPGNQITYPAFFKDNNDDLYVSYRFAATPARSFDDRMMSAGIAVYNTTAQTWTSIGKNISLSQADYESHSSAPENSTPFAGQRGWTAYHPRLVFDHSNRMFVNWFWRAESPGSMLNRPCLVSSQNKIDFSDIAYNPINLPISPSSCGNFGYSNSQEFYSIGNTVIDSRGNVFVILSPKDQKRKIVSYNLSTRSWSKTDSPYNAAEIFFDDEDNLYAIASGLTILKQDKDSGEWSQVYRNSEQGDCYPRVQLDKEKSYAFIHTHSCNGTSASIYAMRLKN